MSVPQTPLPSPPAGFKLNAPTGASSSLPAAPSVPPPPAGFKLNAPTAALPTGGTTAPNFDQASSSLLSGITTKVRDLEGMDRDVDYEPGAKNIFAKWLLERSDNPQEAQLALQHFYGKGNIGQDASGRWWVREGGKKVAVFGGTSADSAGMSVNTSLNKLFWDSVAYAPVTMGAVTGAVAGAGAGAETGPGALVTGALGAGAGAVAGKGIDEFFKNLGGLYAKTPEQEIKTLGREGMWNMAFEMMGPAAKAVVKPVMPWLRRNYFEVTPEISERNARLMTGGAVPPVKTALPGAKITDWHQAYRNAIMGDPKAKGNIAYIQGQLDRILKNEKISPQEREEIIAELNNPDAAPDVLKPGEAITSGVKGRLDNLRAERDTSIQSARDAIKRVDALMTRISKLPQGRLGEDVADAISTDRRDFGAAMTRSYDHVDAMTGHSPVVPTTFAKSVAQKMVNVLPLSGRPRILTEIAFGWPDMIRINDAHRVRSELRSLAQRGGLTPGIDEHDYETLAEAVDASISQASKYAPKAVKFLRETDAAYRDGIAKFKDATFNSMVRRMRSGIAPDPSVVAGKIIKSGETERLNTFWSMANPQVRKQVAAADMANMLKAADGSGEKLMQEIESRGSMFDTVYGSIYGKQFVADMRRHAQELAAIDGKFPIDKLDPGNVATMLKQAADQTAQIDRFVAENPLAAFENPKTKDRAVKFLTAPGSEGRTRAAMESFGPESSEWAEIKKYALKDALGKLFVRDKSGTITINGEAMASHIRKYTKGQQDLLFPNGLEEDLGMIARDAKHLFPSEESDTGRSLAAAAVKGGMPFTLPLYLHAAVGGYITDRPWLIRFFGVLAKSQVPPAVKARLFNRLVLRPALMAGPGSGSPDNKTGNPTP